MRSLFIPLRLATDARGLEFITNLDKNIDKVSRRALYEAQGDSEDVILQKLSEFPGEDGIITGDETRLRQIITNLARQAALTPILDVQVTDISDAQQCLQIYTFGRETGGHH